MDLQLAFDKAVGNAVERAVRSHHRRRLERLSWARALDPPDDGFSLPTRESPVRLKGMPDFVRTLGGGYFFLPGRSLLRYLAHSDGSQESRSSGDAGGSGE